MRLESFFDDIYQPKKLHGKSANTVRLYRVCFRNYGKTLGREPLLADLTNENVSKHMQRMLDEGRSKATANKERCELVALWRYASQLKLIDTWPDVPKEQEPVRTPQAWTVGDMQKLLAAAHKTEGLIGTAPAWLWWVTLIRFCLDTGERIGAVLATEWDWVESDSVVIRAEARKGSKQDKWTRLSGETLDLLRQLRQYRQPGNMVFAWPYSYTYFWREYSKLLEKAGLPTGRRCGAHRLRKTAASVSYAAGLNPQDLLGHTDRRTTQRYLDPRFTRETQPSQILADWLRNPQTTDEKRRQA
jgi:integrase